MRITVLTYLEKEGAEEHDVVVDQVAAALREGHKPSILGVHGDVGKLISGPRAAQAGPGLQPAGDVRRQHPAATSPSPALLDLLGLRYTGGGPGELYLRQDKGLAKKVLAFEKILYPDFAVFSQRRGLRDRRQPAHAALRQAAHARTPRSASTATRWSATRPR